MSVNFKNLNKIQAAIDSLPKFMSQTTDSVGTIVAQRFLDQVKHNIYSQSFAFKKLSDAYLAVKKRQGLDERIFIATQTAVESLRLLKFGKTIVAGVAASDRSADNKIDLEELWRVLELGSLFHSIFPRPVFALTKLEIERELEKLTIIEINRAAAKFFARFR